MSFIAGILSIHEALDEQNRLRFLETFQSLKSESPWEVEIVEGKKAVLVRAGFTYMWQGQKLLSTKKYDAVASGIQWRKIPNHQSTLNYLIKKLLKQEPKIGDYFDHFSCAIVDNEKDLSVLATDYLGLSPILYMTEGKALIFSSHQSFLKCFIKADPEMNRQAVLEYFIIGHNIGHKTLLKNIHVLPPGSLLVQDKRKIKVIPYIDFHGEGTGGMTLKLATEGVFRHLTLKCKSYFDLISKPVAGFLSGGWDSRLIVALFANRGNIAMTYTTQQRARYENRFISEKKIAKDVAHYLGLKNHFIMPKYRNLQNLNKRARALDYTTWFHDWAFTLAEHLPYDHYIYLDGLMGDILLRGLYLTPVLDDAMIKKDREAAARYLHQQYIKGFNTYTQGLEGWKPVIHSDLLRDFSEHLREEIYQEIHNINHDDFITVFLLKNRSRRGISPFPRLIFGTKGEVVFPFCGYELIQKVLSVPRAYRMNGSLYKALLEKIRPGLSEIPSTNTTDLSRLEPYLFDHLSELSWRGRFLRWAKEQLLFPQGMFICWQERASRISDMTKAEQILEDPPQLLMELLSPRLKKAFNNKDLATVSRYRLFLEKILMLDYFYR